MTVDAQRPPDGWVPVENRLLGLDRRTLLPALFVLVVALLLIYGWQAIAAAIPWRNQITAGQLLDLGDGATAVPPVGWQLQKGTLTSGLPTSATSLETLIAGGGTTIEFTGVAFTGSATEFLDQVQRAEQTEPVLASGSRGTITTSSGLVGVSQTSSGPSGDGLDVAFKMSTGAQDAVNAAPALLVRVRGAPGQLAQNQNTITAVLDSITPGADR
ncbi:MAG: hypothetical protein HOV78_13880 [Hamadaea sp.]|nr:hypothetical protein [Hamadaea sp.]